MDHKIGKLAEKPQEGDLPKDQCLSHREDGVPNDDFFENPPISREE